MNKVVLYCRPGFEKEAQQKLPIRPPALRVFGFAPSERRLWLCHFECYQMEDEVTNWSRELPFSSLVSPV